MLKDFNNKDIAKRLFLQYPRGWSQEPSWEDAPDVPVDEQVSPNLKAVLVALASSYAETSVSGPGNYDLLRYVARQSRLNTATGFWLDYIALDFSGGTMHRYAHESDERFRRRLQIEILRDKGSRCAVVCGVANLTGYRPKVIELLNPDDCGAYAQIGDTSIALCGYSIAGAYGSLKLPFQLFIDVTRPNGQGIPNVTGYSNSTAGYASQGNVYWGYGGSFPPNSGTGQYCTLDQLGGDVTDVDIYRNVHESMPAGTTAWTRISSQAPQSSTIGTGFLDINFYLDHTTLGADPEVQPHYFALSSAITIALNARLNVQFTGADINVLVNTVATIDSTAMASAIIPVIVTPIISVAPPFAYAITIAINVTGAIQNLGYLGNALTPNFILGQNTLLPPGGKLGRSFKLGYSKLGAGLYGY